MKCLLFAKLLIAASFAALSATAVHAQGAAAAGAAAVKGISTQATINAIFDKLNAMIDKARDAGDYLTLNAATQAKSTIQSWEAANMNLLDKAFSELNDTQRQVFDNARQLTEQANVDAEQRLKDIQKITDDVAQLVQSTPVTNNTYVTRYSPHIKPAQERTAITLKVVGVNLDKGDPQLIAGEKNAERVEIVAQEVAFTVPVGALASESDKLGLVPLSLTYSTPKAGFWNWLTNGRETVTRQLPIVTLPSNIGHYTYTVTMTTQQRQVKEFESQLQRHSGKNTNQPNIALPPGGWLWDWSQGLGAFEQKQYDGQAGTCNGIDANGSNDQGIKHTAHLDQVKSLWKIGDGWVNCSVKGPVYRIVPVTETSQPQTGILTWTNDIALSLPDGTTAINLEINTFDGLKRIFTGTATDKFFDINRGAQTLLVHPKQPADL